MILNWLVKLKRAKLIMKLRNVRKGAKGRKGAKPIPIKLTLENEDKTVDGCWKLEETWGRRKLEETWGGRLEQGFDASRSDTKTARCEKSFDLILWLKERRLNGETIFNYYCERRNSRESVSVERRADCMGMNNMKCFYAKANSIIYLVNWTNFEI